MYANVAVWSQISIIVTGFYYKQIFMELFQTNSNETVRACQENFHFELPSVLFKKRTEKLEMKFHMTNACL